MVLAAAAVVVVCNEFMREHESNKKGRLKTLKVVFNGSQKT